MLLRARPRAVSRTRLRAAIWPDAHVGETSLHVLVSQLRATLGDDAHEPRFVRTVPGFGYSFPASADADGKPAAAGQRLWLETEASSSSSARARTCRVAKSTSRRGSTGPGVAPPRASAGPRRPRLLEDLASKNGTFLDGQRVVSSRALEDGATIRLGRRASVVFRTDAADPTETEAGDD